MRKAPHGCYWRGNVLWAKKIVRGQLYRWTLRTSDAKLAVKRYSAEADRLVGATYFGEHRMTFEDALEKWVPWIKSSVGHESAERYLASLRVLGAFLAGKHLDEVTGDVVSEIIRARQYGKVSNATIKRDLAALSSVMNFAKMHGWCKDNPVESRKGLVKVRHEPIVLPRAEDIELVIARAPGMIKDLIRAAMATGCRQDELVSAKCSQLDLGARTLTVIGKGRKLRVVDLSPFGGVEVFAALPAGGPDDLLFWHGRRERYAAVFDQFSKMGARLEKEGNGFRRFRFHDLRHLHAVEWLRSGRSIYDLQQRLGHTSIKITEGYCQFLTHEQERAVKGHSIVHSD